MQTIREEDIHGLDEMAGSRLRVQPVTSVGVWVL